MLALLVLASSAAAEVRSGAATSPTSEELPPGQDIVAVSASYDTAAGTISAAVTTAGPPENLSYIGLRTDFYPVDQYGNCVAPEARVAAFYGGSETAWDYGTAGGTGQKSVAGNTTTLTATSPALTNQPFFCMNAYILEETEPEHFEPIEYLMPPIQLKASSPPPPPPAPPAPVPSPAPAPVPPAPAKKLAKLAIGAPKKLTTHRRVSKKVKVTVTNSGNATAAKAKLKIGKVPGIAVEPKSGVLALKAIAPGKSRSVSFKVRLTEKAKTVSTLPLTVTGKGVKATANLVITVPHRGKHKPKPKPKPGPEPKPEPSPLAEKIFYALEIHPSESADLIGYAFVDDTWAYTGIPKGGLPTCTAETGSAEVEGCVKYTFDPKTGAVQLGNFASGKLNAAGGLEIGDESFQPSQIPPAGTRYQVQQEYLTFSGFCGPFSTCTTTHETIVLTSGGEFALSRSSLSTSSGPEIFTGVGSYPADEHGTYEIEPKGRLRLSFADGTVQTRTMFIFLNDQGAPDPAVEGFALDDATFYYAKDG